MGKKKRHRGPSGASAGGFVHFRMPHFPRRRGAQKEQPKPGVNFKRAPFRGRTRRDPHRGWLWGSYAPPTLPEGRSIKARRMLFEPKKQPGGAKVGAPEVEEISHGTAGRVNFSQPPFSWRKEHEERAKKERKEGEEEAEAPALQLSAAHSQEPQRANAHGIDMNSEPFKTTTPPTPYLLTVTAQIAERCQQLLRCLCCPCLSLGKLVSRCCGCWCGCCCFRCCQCSRYCCCKRQIQDDKDLKAEGDDEGEHTAEEEEEDDEEEGRPEEIAVMSMDRAWDRDHSLPPSGWEAADFSGMFSGTDFIDAEGQRHGPERLAGRVVGVYFGASWCGPARTFTKELASFTRELQQQEGRGPKFEVVYVSLDKDPTTAKFYFRDTSMPWLAIPFDDEDRLQNITDYHQVLGIPQLRIFGAQGQPLAQNAVGKLTYLNFERWQDGKT